MQVVDLYLRQQWEDGRLVYQVDDRDGIVEVVVPRDRRVWSPDTYFSNGHDVHHEKRHRMVIEPTGYVRSSEMFAILLSFKLAKIYFFFFKFLLIY